VMKIKSYCGVIGNNRSTYKRYITEKEVILKRVWWSDSQVRIFGKTVNIFHLNGMGLVGCLIRHMPFLKNVRKLTLELSLPNCYFTIYFD